MSSINVEVNRNNNIISVGINSTGPQGQSAYETWLALGNVGTKEDFLSLQFDEPARVTNENTRKANELIRIANENERISNENTRKSNESGRVTAENNRVLAEQSRVEADILRGQTVETIEQNYAPRLTSAESAISNLNTNKLPTSHNTDVAAHNDIRQQINALDAKVGAVVVTNSTELNLALSNGKNVIVIKKNADISVSSTIMIPEGTMLIGYGAKLTRAVGFQDAMLRLAANCHIVGLTINGNRTAMASPTWDTTTEIRVALGKCVIDDITIIDGNEAIVVYGDDVIIRGCKITNCGGNGIHFSGANRTNVENCTIIGTNKVVGMGHEDGCIIWSNLCENTTCTNNYLKDGLSGFGSLDSIDNSNITLANNTIVNMINHAIDIVAPADNAADNIVITGNRIYNSKMVSVKNVSTTPTSITEQVIISNNILIDTYLDIRNVNNIIVSGNVIRRSIIDLSDELSGIQIIRTNNICITGNIIENYKYSLYPDDFTTGISIGNNIFKNFGRYGLNLAWIVNASTNNNKFINDSADLSAVSGIIPIIVGKNCLAIGNTIKMNNCQRGMQINTGGKAFNNRIITVSGTPSILIGGGVTDAVAKFNIIDQPITNSAGAGANVVDNYTAVV